MKLRPCKFLPVLFLTIIIICGCGSALPTPTPGMDDGDADGIEDTADNCPDVSNLEQSDLDSDGLGDACDADADGDGFEAEDCDDLDAEIFPGAEDVPDGELSDANCDGLDGNISSAIWVAGEGDDTTGDGSISHPYRTLQKGVEQALLNPEKDIYVAQGTYTQTEILLMRGASMYGGFGPLEGASRPRDPDTYVSRIDGVADYALVGLSASETGHESVISGFTVEDRAFFIGEGNPVIRGNKINVAVSIMPYYYGIIISTMLGVDINATIEENQITIPDNADLEGGNMGIVAYNYTDDTNIHLVIRNNTIFVGRANFLTSGILAWGTTALARISADIEGNDIRTQAAYYQAGIFLGAKIDGGSLSEAFFTEAEIKGNTVIGDQNVFSGFFALALGLNAFTSPNNTVITNNILVAGKGEASAGVMAYEVKFNLWNNTIITSQATETQLGILMHGEPFRAVEASIVNNIFSTLSTLGPDDIAIAFHEDVSFLELSHNLFHPGYLTFLWQDAEDGINIPSLEELNALEFSSDNLGQIPQFLNQEGLDFHLANAEAPGVDAGMSLDEVTIDIDGQSRVNGPFDIGADEI